MIKIFVILCIICRTVTILILLTQFLKFEYMSGFVDHLDHCGVNYYACYNNLSINLKMQLILTNIYFDGDKD